MLHQENQDWPLQATHQSHPDYVLNNPREVIHIGDIMDLYID